VPWHEHEGHVHEQQLRLLQALADRRPPDADDLHRAALLGRRRAGQGLPVEAVIGAYHVGNAELWERLRAEPGLSAQLLSDVAALMWEEVRLITAALSAAHAEVTRALQADRITLWHRLIELLRSGVVDEEAAQIATAVGLDPDGSFLAVACSAVTDDDGDGLAALRDAVDSLRGTAVCVRSGESVVVLTQGVDPDTLLAAVSRVRPGSPLGVGLARASLAGARQSLRDAERALGTAGRGAETRRFADHWLQAALLADAGDLRALVERRLDRVRENPHLADAVIAFAAEDLSATSAARRLGLHPNSTMYRLARWHELTGWDLRTFRGLSISLLACWIAAAEQRSVLD
jgi:sugar diacid utilization regulator